MKHIEVLSKDRTYRLSNLALQETHVAPKHDTFSKLLIIFALASISAVLGFGFITIVEHGSFKEVAALFIWMYQ